MLTLGIVCVALIISSPLRAQDGSPIKSDERVVLFDTAGWLDEAANTWHVPIAGWIFEPEEDSATRELLLRQFAAVLDLPPDSMDSEVFRRRAAAFFVDNERGKRVLVRVGSGVATRWIQPGRSAANGRFSGELRLHASDAAILLSQAADNGGWTPTATRPRRGDGNVFSGRVHLVPPEGLSVVTDIDDTIKVSEVRDRQALLERTFLREFEAADGAARMYAWLAEQGAAFHYVSSSPVQLSEAITGFLDAHGFPRGSMHLKEFRWKDRSFFNLFTSSMETKPPVIEEILARWPRRRFLLIGDSGEQDPEIYGKLARAHPEQVRGILIRDVTGEGRDSPRYGKAFAGLPVECWMLLAAEDLTPIGDSTATESSASGIQGFLKGILPESQEGSGD